MTHVHVKPELLRWARERAGLTREDLAKKFEKIVDWEEGRTPPSFKQLQRFANDVHVPYGYLFLSDPPEERISIADFRTVANTPKSRPSPDLIDTLHAMEQRQIWLREHLLANEADPLNFVSSASLVEDTVSVAQQMRVQLGLNEDWLAHVRTWQEAVNELRRLIEDLRVMVVINGVVGNNTRRKLSGEEFRGFAMTDRYAPLIFVNGADAKSAQMFTLVHELAHIWLGETGLSSFENMLPAENKVEKWCNEVAAELLVPAESLVAHWSSAPQHVDTFKTIARKFKVSPIVAARRAFDLELIERETYIDFYKKYVKEEYAQSEDQSGGDFYNNQNTRVGKLFGTYVIRAALAGHLGFRDAYVLTDLWGGAFHEYAKKLGILN